jgi:hypothetical protein
VCNKKLVVNSIVYLPLKAGGGFSLPSGKGKHKNPDNPVDPVKK